jgi:hypothetical protein
MITFLRFDGHAVTRRRDARMNTPPANAAAPQPSGELLEACLLDARGNPPAVSVTESDD